MVVAVDEDPGLDVIGASGHEDLVLAAGAVPLQALVISHDAAAADHDGGSGVGKNNLCQ